MEYTRNVPTAHMVEVLRTIFYRVIEEKTLEFHPSDMEKVKNNEWLKSVLDSKGGDLRAAVQALLDRNVLRQMFHLGSKNYNVKLDKKYSKAVKPVGTDNKGFKVLFTDISELLHLNDDKEIHEHIIYWMERLERQGNEKITIVLHHGRGKFMGPALKLVEFFQDIIFTMYPVFLASFFIFEDFLSSNCKVGLGTVIGDNFMFVDESDWSCFFKLHEKYDLNNGYLKLALKKPFPVKNSGQECHKSTAALVEQCSEEIKKSVSEIGDEEKQLRNKLKQILARLHDVENQVFQLIQEVQELI